MGQDLSGAFRRLIVAAGAGGRLVLRAPVVAGLIAGSVVSLAPERVEAAPPPARLDVDTSAVGDAGPVVKRRVEERGATVLRDLGVGTPPQGQGPVLSLIVRELGGDTPGYELEASVLDKGNEVPGTRAVVVCSLCTEGELVDRAENELRKLVAGLERYAAETAAETTPEGPEVEGGQSGDPTGNGQPQDGRDTQSRGKLGKLGWTGVGMTAVGGAGIIAGVVLAVLPDKPLESDPTQERYTTVPGYVTLGAGAAVAIVGGALIGVDVSRSKRARVSADLSPTRAGMRLSLDF